MNLILKIVQGPNAGAEIALIEGVNVKLGKSDECDIVLTDQSLPDVACEIEVGSERVMLLLPGGGQERLEPLKVKVFETTAIAIGPGDGPWGQLIWPDPEEEKVEEVPEPEEKAEEPPPPRFKKLQIALLVVLLLVVLLEFAIWLFWPTVNAFMERARTWCKAKYEAWTVDELELAAMPIHRRTLEELAAVYKVDVRVPSMHSDRKAELEGNLKTRADRLRLTAEAYSIRPGLQLKLTDDETMRDAVQEILDMIVPGKLKIEEAVDRKLVLSGRVPDIETLKRVLNALAQDVPYLTKTDYSKVSINPYPLKQEDDIGIIAVDKQPDEATPAAAEEEQSSNRKLNAKLPVVGVMTMPYPCLVLKNGTRVLEGAEFLGYIVDKIEADVILLKQGDITYEWRP